MKQYNFFKIAVLSSILLIGTTGCEDFLTKDHPTATTDDEFWKTMNECENALGQCRSWPKAGHGGDDLSFVCMEGMTDNMYESGSADMAGLVPFEFVAVVWPE